jgi:hypothetical protein
VRSVWSTRAPPRGVLPPCLNCQYVPDARGQSPARVKRWRCSPRLAGLLSPLPRDPTYGGSFNLPSSRGGSGLEMHRRHRESGRAHLPANLTPSPTNCFRLYLITPGYKPQRDLLVADRGRYFDASSPVGKPFFCSRVSIDLFKIKKWILAKRGSYLLLILSTKRFIATVNQ